MPTHPVQPPRPLHLSHPAVSPQVGHEHSSTTSIYTCVSSDFRTRTLRRHLDAAVAEALREQETRG
ncbi:MAG: hypothetical protein ACRDQU_13930 [Pseudonocardiaceae bacterium]